MVILVVGFDGDGPVSLSTEGSLLLAASAEEADMYVARGAIDAIVAKSPGWSRTWVEGLPLDTRPAVLVLGSLSERAAAEADDWAPDGTSATELATRVRIAVQRSRIRRRAFHRGNVDPLTGLPNRRGIIVSVLRAAAQYRRQGTRLSIVLLDLDNFKRVNEQQGHDAGDRLLRKVGQLLRDSTRKDEVCGRIGGDEFVVVITGDAHQAELVCRRIEHALRTEGIGVTCVGQELGRTEDIRELYRRVDAQLRARKSLRPQLGPSLPGPGHPSTTARN